MNVCVIVAVFCFATVCDVFLSATSGLSLYSNPSCQGAPYSTEALDVGCENGQRIMCTFATPVLTPVPAPLPSPVPTPVPAPVPHHPTPPVKVSYFSTYVYSGAGCVGPLLKAQSYVWGACNEVSEASSFRVEFRSGDQNSVIQTNTTFRTRDCSGPSVTRVDAFSKSCVSEGAANSALSRIEWTVPTFNEDGVEFE